MAAPHSGFAVLSDSPQPGALGDNYDQGVELVSLNDGGNSGWGDGGGGDSNPDSAGAVAAIPASASAEKSTVIGAITNFVNSIIGAGIIGLPFALQEAGLVAGLVLLVGIAFMTAYSSQLIVRLGISVGRLDYEDLCDHAFGNRGLYTITVAMFLFAWGAMVGYLVILSDTLATVLSHWAGWSEGDDGRHSQATRRWVLLVTSLALVLPLSLVRNMSNLAKTSALSLVAVVYIVLAVVVRCIGGAPGAAVPTPNSPHNDMPLFASNVFPAIGVIAFAFVCHHNSFIVFNSLKVSTMANWSVTARASVGVSLCACLLLGLFGYLQFRGLTRDNLLNNYSAGDEVVNVARVLYAATMVTTYPMEVFVSRHCINVILRRMRSSAHLASPTAIIASSDSARSGSGDSESTLDSMSESLQQQSSLQHAPSRVSSFQHITISLCLFGSTLIVALITDNLGIVLEITGGVSATILGFIMPAALFFRITSTPMAFWRHEEGALAGFKIAWPGLGLGAFGIVAFFCSTILTLIKAFKDVK